MNEEFMIPPEAVAGEYDSPLDHFDSFADFRKWEIAQKLKVTGRLNGSDRAFLYHLLSGEPLDVKGVGAPNVNLRDKNIAFELARGNATEDELIKKYETIDRNGNPKRLNKNSGSFPKAARRGAQLLLETINISPRPKELQHFKQQLLNYFPELI